MKLYFILVKEPSIKAKNSERAAKVIDVPTDARASPTLTSTDLLLSVAFRAFAKINILSQPIAKIKNGIT